MIYFSISNGYFISTNVKNYGVIKIQDDSFLTLVGSLSCVCNGGGRFMWGYLSDKIGFKKIYILILIIQIIEIATIRFISEYKVAFLFWICIALLCEGCHFVIYPPLCLRVFGPNVGSKIYGILLLVCSTSNLTQYGINLAVRPVIGFDNEFFIYLGFTFISLLFCIFTEIKYKK